MKLAKYTSTRSFCKLPIALAGSMGILIGILYSKKQEKKLLQSKEQRIEKFVNYFNILDQWMLLREEGKSISNFFEDNQFYNIAIYGFGKLGTHLYEELKGSSINIAYAIDKKAKNTNGQLELYTLNDPLPQVDAIVVTPTFDYKNILEEMKTSADCPILSLEDIICECQYTDE